MGIVAETWESQAQIRDNLKGFWSLFSLPITCRASENRKYVQEYTVLNVCPYQFNLSFYPSKSRSGSTKHQPSHTDRRSPSSSQEAALAALMPCNEPLSCGGVPAQCLPLEQSPGQLRILVADAGACHGVKPGHLRRPTLIILFWARYVEFTPLVECILI